MHFTQECTRMWMCLPTNLCVCVFTQLCLCVFSCGPKVPLQYGQLHLYNKGPPAPEITWPTLKTTESHSQTITRISPSGVFLPPQKLKCYLVILFNSIHYTHKIYNPAIPTNSRSHQIIQPSGALRGSGSCPRALQHAAGAGDWTLRLVDDLQRLTAMHVTEHQ